MLVQIVLNNLRLKLKSSDRPSRLHFAHVTLLNTIYTISSRNTAESCNIIVCHLEIN